MDLQEVIKQYHMFVYFSKWSPARRYTVREVADILKEKPETVFSYIRTGMLNAEIAGNNDFRISSEDLEDYFLNRYKGIRFYRVHRCLG